MKVTFYANVELSALSVVQFYKVDLDILKELGYEIKITNSYRQIDWSSDVIFVWWWTYAFIPVILGKLFCKKVIITGTFNYKAPDAPIDYFRRPLWQRFLIKYAAKYADMNIMVSKKEYDQIKKDWNYNNFFYSPHVINTNFYKPNSLLNRESFVFTIMWTGKLNLQRKCLPEIIESANLLVQILPNLKFIIAGRKGDGFEYASKIVEDYNLKNNVFLIGEISENEKIKYLQTCAIYLQPTKYEGFGLAIAEAMACGAPIITSDAGEVRNVVGDAGIILKGHTPSEIANAVYRLISDKQFCDELSYKAVKRINSQFSFERRKNDFKKIFEF